MHSNVQMFRAIYTYAPRYIHSDFRAEQAGAHPDFVVQLISKNKIFISATSTIQPVTQSIDGDLETCESSDEKDEEIHLTERRALGSNAEAK
jgi:hypothetical protein